MCSANLQQRRKESKVLSLMALSLEQIQFHTTTGIAGIFATTRRNESTSAMERKRDASIVFPSFLRPPRNCIRRGGQESTFRHSYTSTQHSNAATTNDIYISGPLYRELIPKTPHQSGFFWARQMRPNFHIPPALCSAQQQTVKSYDWPQETPSSSRSHRVRKEGYES